jgi:lysophospholipase L1-like esterase
MKRLLPILTALAALLAVAAVPASAKTASPPPVTRGSTYLALGDSVVFGYQEAEVRPAPNYANQRSLVGFPEITGRNLHLKIVNASCPGETTASLINQNAQSNGCENTLTGSIGYRDLHPLHVKYKGSQLDYAVAYLKSHKNVRLVSLMVGANDLFICQKEKAGCTKASDQRAVFNQINTNVRKILSAIRNKAHYRGQLVVVRYYSLDYGSAFITGVVQALDSTLANAAQPSSAVMADGFGQFKQGSRIFGNNPCTAGLLTNLGAPGKCGVHPSYSGQSLLADAVMQAVRN